MKLVLALTALFAFAPTPADTIAFGPKEGTKLEKRFEMRMRMEKRSMSMSVGGQDLPAEMLEDATMDLTSDQTIVVEDEYKKIDGDRPLLLERQFTKLAKVQEQKVLMVGMEKAQEEKKEKESKLADQTVRFRWNDKESRYDKEWVGDGADSALLEGLEEDMDLRKLLPEKAVSVGDTWQIDLKDFGDILGPGGKLGFVGDDKEEDSDFEDNLTGEVTCTYKGEQELDGRKVARIAAVCKAKTFQDGEEGEGPAMHMDFDISLEGEFLWDVGAKHIASYEMTGEVAADMKLTQEIDMGGKSGELLIKIALGGKIEVEGEFTAK
ncbi:MAG: hypothetical protein NTY35_02915 [Planctomycetota bacterium]|nr:hypothetical protein [Planctomycetota bacterium]